MFAAVSILFSQFKIFVVAVALVGGTAVAVVVDQVAPSGAQGSQHSGADDEGTLGSERDELLEEFAEGEALSSEERAELLAEFAEECGPDAVLTDAELAALDAMTEDQAEAFFEPLIEACELAEERAELLAEFAEECGPDAVLTEAELAALDAMTEDQLEAFFEPLIEACEEANEVPDPNLPPCKDEDEDDDEDHDDEDESEGGDT